MSPLFLLIPFSIAFGVVLAVSLCKAAAAGERTLRRERDDEALP